MSDMRKLLESMYKFAGGPDQKPGDQVRGTEKASTKGKGKKHPFLHRLVGDSKEYALKNELMAEYDEFKEAEPSALERWRSEADKRTKQQDQDQAEYERKKGPDFEKEFAKWQKEVHGKKINESFYFQGYQIDVNPTTRLLTVSRNGQVLHTEKTSMFGRPGGAEAIKKRVSIIIDRLEDEKYPDDLEVRENEGDCEGLPHLTKELLSHIVQQVETEGPRAIVKSLEWGDGAAKDLLDLIAKDLKGHLDNKEITEYGTYGAYGTETPPTGTTTEKQQQDAEQASQQAVLKNLNQIKAQGTAPIGSTSQTLTALTKAGAGQTLNTQDKTAISSATGQPMDQVLSNPQLAGKYKSLLQQLQQQNKAK